jgi:hypothetical protein
MEMHGKSGDLLLFVADKPKGFDSVGITATKLADDLNLIAKDDFKFI